MLTSVGVVREYFVRDTDEQAAALLTSAEPGVIGVCPITELVSLESLLLGRGAGDEAALELMDRPDHAVIVATDGTNLWVNRVADHTVALIAGADPGRLTAALQPWSQIEEFAGLVTGAELAEVMAVLQPLFRSAVEEGRHVYVRTSC